MRSLALALALTVLAAAPAAADDDGRRFHRTTPRATLEMENGALLLGVPGGRAWGVESELRPLPADGVIIVRLAVDDEAVDEAFVRIAYYATLAGRSRQIAIADSEAVASGETRLLLLRLEPPPRAVGFRVRVLARLRTSSQASRTDGIRFRVIRGGAEREAGSLFSRLLPDKY